MRRRLWAGGLVVAAILYYAPSVVQDSLLEPPPRFSTASLPSIRIPATMYTCSRDETDGDPTVTASGMRCGHPVMAVSQDLRRRFKYGSHVRVNGEWLIVGDTMHERITNQIDLPAPSKEVARRWGRRAVTLEYIP